MFDHHLIPWLKANFNLTIAQSSFAPADSRYHAYIGDYDLDIKEASGPTIFGAALEYSACYDGELLDKLVEIEMGEIPERIQLPNNYMEMGIKG